MKKVITILLALALMMALATTAFAAGSTVTYTGKTNLFEFEPGSYYTNTDLFENFKSVMPGDVRSEVVTVENKYRGCDYVRIWMTALLHDEKGNPISPKVLEELKADDRKGELSELEYMHDFLDQMTLTVWKGEKVDKNIIYQGKPSSLEKGFEDENVYLGQFDYNDSVKLNVELAVDVEMGNEYADRIGEVDWVFVVEERDKPTNPATGDNTPIVLVSTLAVVSLAGVVLLLTLMRREKRRK